MKRAARILALLSAPLLAVGCDSQPPPVAEAPAKPELSLPAAKGPTGAPKKKKLPGIHSPAANTTPKSRL
jgi:hypothetical protein